jgi:hypothetical protein
MKLVFGPSCFSTHQQASFLFFRLRHNPESTFGTQPEYA